MDQCQIDGIDELKVSHDVHYETNMKSIKNINIKKNTSETDHRTPKRKNDISNLNTLKKKKKYETALAAIFPENDQSYTQYAQDYAEGYIRKMRERLDTEAFDLAIKLLTSFGDADDSNINLLYQQLTEVFTSKNEDLIYEFLGFLLPGQALSIGKFTDYLELTRIKDFIRKLQVCMKKQQSQVRKIFDNLLHLSKSENITSLDVHTSMLPLLKSNPILVDCFFQLIPTERPPECFFSDDNWENLDIDQSINCGIDYEEIIPSDSEDHTLLNVCQCICHKPGDNTHCTSCGLKFFKGRIYFDTPEGLKLAKISFEGTDPSIAQSKIDKTEVNITVKRKNRKGLIKNSSPGSAEDIKGSTGTESEEDLIDVKPKKRQKSKVVQSLKLKFKKEESPKCKEDQATYNETGKSIVHVTNEELDSSEMVFFCIPEAESSVKSVPKKKLKVDVKESLVQKQSENINQNNTEIINLDNSNLVNLEKSEKKNNEISTEDLLDINIDNCVLKETKTDINLVPLIEQHQILKMELSSQSVVLNNDFPINNAFSNMHQKYIDESNKRIIKNESIEDIKKEFDQNIYTELLNNCYVSTTTTSTTDIDKPLLDEKTITIKSKVENLPECCTDERRQDNEETVAPNSNESLLDKNIAIKNEVMKNLTKFYVDEKKQDNNETDKIIINESFLDKNVAAKSGSTVNLPECYRDEKKQDNNESEKQQINKWTIDEDKIILQTCKRVEDIEVLLEIINRKIPQRSVSEIQERFTTLMTLLEQMVDVK